MQATYGYLARDGVTVVSVYHVWDSGNEEHDADAETRAGCKRCTKDATVRAKVSDARATERGRSLARDASRSDARSSNVETETNETKSAAELRDAMLASMAEESSEESEAFRARLARTLENGKGE